MEIELKKLSLKVQVENDLLTSRVSEFQKELLVVKTLKDITQTEQNSEKNEDDGLTDF